jgi:hypothetical protein
MLRYLKANMGIDRLPVAAAMKLAQQPITAPRRLQRRPPFHGQ